ncbi:MAG: 2-aminoethylphosphonate--pyruvate transaminase, partial [Desulfatirhabdiaceae bacterium]
TTRTVKQVMMQDWCTWDTDYNRIVQQIRNELVSIATVDAGYTSVLMQGSGTFGVEAVVTTVIPRNGKLLVLANGAYGQRIAAIAGRAEIPVRVDDSGETRPPGIDRLVDILKGDGEITHVAVVHCETTTGILNPVSAIGETVRAFDKTYIVDAMSSFGGIRLDMGEIHADYLISSANKCIQGVPGFSFVIAKRKELEKTKGQARSLSLDLYDQWETMEKHDGKWRFTSPTHVVRAFAQALRELREEGGVIARNQRYRSNQKRLVYSMRNLGFQPLLREEWQSPIITAFHYPDHAAFSFRQFYGLLKNRGFVIYPGKVTDTDTFRIGTIGNVYPDDITRLLQAVEASMYWL